MPRWRKRLLSSFQLPASSFQLPATSFQLPAIDRTGISSTSPGPAATRRLVEIERDVRVISQDRRRTAGLMCPSSVALTAGALRSSGTTISASRAFIICRIDIEIAVVGTSSILANDPSPTC